MLNCETARVNNGRTAQLAHKQRNFETFDVSHYAKNNLCVFQAKPLMSKVALFNKYADQHQQKQAINPFSNGQAVGNMPKPHIPKDEYGRQVLAEISTT